jgi:hypothetical protein
LSPTQLPGAKGNESIPFNGFTAFIPCADNRAGELVILDGDLHILISTTINGNNVSGKDHFQPQSLSVGVC